MQHDSFRVVSDADGSLNVCNPFSSCFSFLLNFNATCIDLLTLTCHIISDSFDGASSDHGYGHWEMVIASSMSSLVIYCIFTINHKEIKFNTGFNLKNERCLICTNFIFDHLFLVLFFHLSSP